MCGMVTPRLTASVLLLNLQELQKTLALTVLPHLLQKLLLLHRSPWMLSRLPGQTSLKCLLAGSPATPCRSYRQCHMVCPVASAVRMH